MTRLSFATVVSVLVCLALTGSAGADLQPAPGAVAIGPYVQNVTQTEATVCWSTLDGQASATGPDGTALSARSYLHHEVTLRGLKPDTEYDYGITPNPSTAGTFRTAPPPTTPFGFVVIGDTRSRHDVHARVVQAVMEQRPAFVLNTGDLISNGRRMEDWEAFFRASAGLMRNIAYYPVVGNHENDATLYFDFFSLPGDERNYTFDWGGAHFICIDLEGPDFERPQAFPYGEIVRGGTREQYLRELMAFLRADLDEHAATPFVFVTFHYPPISAKASRLEGAEQVRDFLGNVFAAHRVTAVLNGHDHYYMRAQAEGVTYVVAGGGGAPLYEPDAPPQEAVKIAKVEHLVRVDIQPPADNTPGLATFTVYDLDGNVIDTWQTPSR